jgi:hypothetical protein
LEETVTNTRSTVVNGVGTSALEALASGAGLGHVSRVPPAAAKLGSKAANVKARIEARRLEARDKVVMVYRV